jgi:hypothetical protein
MDGQGREQFLDKLVPLSSSLRCVSAGRTVRQFN